MRWLLLCLVGCRLGFDPRETVTPPADEGTSIDAPPNAMTTMVVARADTYVSQDMEAGDDRPNNFGAEDKLKVKLGEDHTLLAFDLSAIPSTATVFSAELSVQVISVGGLAPQLEAHALLEDWVEGTAQGTAGVCNWTQRDAVNAWAMDGALPPGSADATAATAPIVLGAAAIALPKTIVQPWLDPTSNHGLLVVAATDDDFELASRESAQAPSLTVVWVP